MGMVRVSGGVTAVQRAKDLWNVRLEVKVKRLRLESALLDYGYDTCSPTRHANSHEEHTVVLSKTTEIYMGFYDGHIWKNIKTNSFCLIKE
jgi:hypothetical protein